MVYLRESAILGAKMLADRERRLVVLVWRHEPILVALPGNRVEDVRDFRASLTRPEDGLGFVIEAKPGLGSCVIGTEPGTFATTSVFADGWVRPAVEQGLVITLRPSEASRAYHRFSCYRLFRPAPVKDAAQRAEAAAAIAQTYGGDA